MNGPAWIAVESSLLVAVRYSSDQILELHFHSGAIYRYFKVPAEVFQDLLTAQSKGTYFNRQIRDRFPYQRLE
jgi:hypothetical protein